MSDTDAIEVKIRSFATPCSTCSMLHRSGVKHVRDRALASGGLAHLYRDKDRPLCEEPEHAEAVAAHTGWVGVFRTKKP